jgi:DNA-binding MarR family transcriptional regulator
MLVLRQLTAVLDRNLAQVTRSMNLTPHDVLVLGWMAQIPGISGSNIASRVGRTRQNVQASLERLERFGLVEKYAEASRGRHVGWGLTNRGEQVWGTMLRVFQVQEEMLQRCGVTRQFLNGLDDLIVRMMRNPPAPTTWSPLSAGFIEVAGASEVADLDGVSGEVELPAQGDEV